MTSLHFMCFLNAVLQDDADCVRIGFHNCRRRSCFVIDLVRETAPCAVQGIAAKSASDEIERP